MEEKSFEPDIFNADCPAQRALDTIADKWTVLVILALLHGTKRHSTLLRKISGISQKMLTQTLRKLERKGLVTRTAYPSARPIVEYSLTPLAATLSEPLCMLSAWAEKYSTELSGN